MTRIAATLALEALRDAYAAEYDRVEYLASESAYVQTTAATVALAACDRAIASLAAQPLCDRVPEGCLCDEGWTHGMCPLHGDEAQLRIEPPPAAPEAQGGVAWVTRDGFDSPGDGTVSLHGEKPLCDRSGGWYWNTDAADVLHAALLGSNHGGSACRKVRIIPCKEE